MLMPTDECLQPARDSMDRKTWWLVCRAAAPFDVTADDQGFLGTLLPRDWDDDSGGDLALTLRLIERRGRE